MEQRKSWAIKDEAILEELTGLTKMTEEEKQVLGQLKENAEENSKEMVDAFYDRLTDHENTNEFINGKLEKMRITLHQWFVELFQGRYDKEYVLKRLEIGKVHVKIGLPVRYPLAMMDIIMEHGQRIAQSSSNPDVASNAFRKLASLDIAIFNQAYESTQLKHLAKMLGNEMLARRILTQEEGE